MKGKIEEEWEWKRREINRSGGTAPPLLKISGSALINV
jgi:hypothetical protein